MAGAWALPAILHLTGRRVVVVGGGPVGRRKAHAALDAGAVVRVVAPEPRPAGFDHPAAEWVAEPYAADHLAGAAVVFAAATPEVNARVVRDAQARGVWVCSATDPDAGDFTLPAVGRCGGLTVAVGTGGAAPALARRVRDRLMAEFDATFAAWVELLDEVRPLAAAIPDGPTRRRVLDELADWPWLERLRRDGRDATLAAIREAIRAASGDLSR